MGTGKKCNVKSERIMMIEFNYIEAVAKYSIFRPVKIFIK